MCIGDKRRLNIPVTMAFGRYGNGHGIPGFISVTMDIELKDHYPRNFTPYYARRIEKIAYLQEYIEDAERKLADHDRKVKLGLNAPPAGEEDWQKRRREKDEADIEKERKELKNIKEKQAKLLNRERPDYIRDPEQASLYPLPYHYMENEFLLMGMEGFPPEQRIKLQEREEKDNHWNEKEIGRKRQKADKYYNLSIMVLRKQRIINEYNKDPTNERLKGFVEKMKDPVIRQNKPIPRGITEYRFREMERERKEEKKEMVKRRKQRTKGKHHIHKEKHKEEGGEKVEDNLNNEVKGEHSEL